MSEFSVELRQMKKTVDGIPVLADATLRLKQGEVHALLGDRGAGKSTLMEILRGIRRSDGGEILVDGRPVRRLSRRRARRLGIGYVSRRPQADPSMAVLDYLLMGKNGPLAGLHARAAARQRLGALAEEYGLALDLRARMGALPPGDRIGAALLRSLLRGCGIFLFDEATQELTPQQADTLHQWMRQLAREGRTVLFSTRSPEEALAAADRCTVLRQGRTEAVLPTAEADGALLRRLMLGRDGPWAPRKKEIAVGSVVLEVRRGTVGGRKRRDTAVRNVSLEARAGEILCITAQKGNGLTALADGLAGVRPLRAGRILLRRKNITAFSALERAEAGVGYLPGRDRGLALSCSMAENLMMKRSRDPLVQDSGWIRRRGVEQLTDRFFALPGMGDLPDPSVPAREMSRGQRKRMALAREMDRGAEALLALQPTAGLNTQERNAVWRMLLAFKENRRAVILLTTDPEEAMFLGDRILVLRGGEIVGEFQGEFTTARELGLYMIGDKWQGGEDVFDEE